MARHKRGWVVAWPNPPRALLGVRRYWLVYQPPGWLYRDQRWAWTVVQQRAYIFPTEAEAWRIVGLLGLDPRPLMLEQVGGP
jgi:hypothetical protein